MKKSVLGLILTALLVMGLSTVACASQGVNVTLPEFKVTINGEEFNNSYSQYPLIVYKDITYFPMTYNGCRFLGLETYWKGNAEGLFIEATGVTVAYNPYRTSAKNNRQQVATVPVFPVTVNGKAIDNSEQEYPLLLFRNITYFPLTWNYGVEAFGWDYSFDSSKGLVINSDNIKLTQKKLPENRAKLAGGGFKHNVAVTGDYVYYEDSQGQIIQSPLYDTSVAKAVYQFPIWTYGDGKTRVNAELYAKDGQAFLSYHQGGATMGTDYLIKLNDDGTTTLINNTRYNIKTFGDKSFKYWAGPAPGPGELFIQGEDGEWHQLGNPDLLYGWAWRVSENQSGGGPSEDVYLAGDDLYILGFDFMHEDQSTTGIYRININTGETERISEKEVTAFQIEGDHIYYSSQGNMYQYSLIDGKEEMLKELVKAPNFISRFAVLNSNIFWQDGLDRNLYNLQGEALNPGAELDGIKFAGDNDEYLVCTFTETAQSKYRIMVLDRNGKVVFKTSDKAYNNNIYITGNKIYFYNISSGTVCIGELR